MTRQVPVVNMAGDFEESIDRLSVHLGTNKVRRQIFKTIYGRKSKPRSIKQIVADARISESKMQQVRNELDFLSRHNLIEKLENDGLVEDGSKFLYKKNETVRANRDRIIALADNRTLADHIPTKRRVTSFENSNGRNIGRSRPKPKKNLAVLYLTASPESKESLRVDVEVRRVQQAIRSSKFRDKIMVEFRPAADIQSILKGLNYIRPKIVHFSGHSSAEGVAADNQSVDDPGYVDLSFDLLAQALQATDEPPNVVVLNSCESSAAKDRVLKSAKVLVSMKRGISDIAAAAFAPQFYAAIASGQSVQAAFNQGAVAVAASSISEIDTPELSCAPTVDATKLVLV